MLKITELLLTHNAPKDSEEKALFSHRSGKGRQWGWGRFISRAFPPKPSLYHECLPHVHSDMT